MFQARRMDRSPTAEARDIKAAGAKLGGLAPPPTPQPIHDRHRGPLKPQEQLTSARPQWIWFSNHQQWLAEIFELEKDEWQTCREKELFAAQSTKFRWCKFQTHLLLLIQVTAWEHLKK